MIIHKDDKLRVAFIAGSLTQGGAEKQFVYMVQALLKSGVDVRVYTLTRGEYYEALLKSMGVHLVWIGQYSNQISRLITLILSLRNFRPHVIQSTHFFSNLYVSIIAPIYHAVGIGSIRSDLIHDLEANPTWGKLLLKKGTALITNSQIGKHNAVLQGVAPGKIHFLPNVIDLVDFDTKTANLPIPSRFTRCITVVGVGRMIPAKRFDRFISALSFARQKIPFVSGILIGEGPERIKLQVYARQKGLTDDCLQFLGQRDDVPTILRKADILMVTSDHEGFPNVLLEAMAASLPVITTSVGDASSIIQDSISGYVVPCDDMDMLVNNLLKLIHSPDLREKMGQQGRLRVEQFYTVEGLAGNLLSIYQLIADQCQLKRMKKALSMLRTATE